MFRRSGGERRRDFERAQQQSGQRVLGGVVSGRRRGVQSSEVEQKFGVQVTGVLFGVLENFVHDARSGAGDLVIEGLQDVVASKHGGGAVGPQRAKSGRDGEAWRRAIRRRRVKTGRAGNAWHRAILPQGIAGSHGRGAVGL